MEPFWDSYVGGDLAQGDFLPQCLIPIFRPEFGVTNANSSAEVPVGTADLIIVTQSCDLANGKAEFAALCRITSLETFQHSSPGFNKGVWEEVRKGRREGLHMLASPENPQANTEALVVDFRQIYSLPVSYLSEHVDKLGGRWRLKSPFLEHFSQSFARFFMRVGLPSTIPSFK